MIAYCKLYTTHTALQMLCRASLAIFFNGCRLMMLNTRTELVINDFYA